jgi:NAD(P)-dependent dehydrogenase (short-subunit alcohol dehydrogenase family)
MSIQGKAYAVTGGSGNLGHATAALLLERGATLALFDHDARRSTEAFAKEIVAGLVSVTAVDLTDETAVSAAVQAERARRGRFDGIVCTVGGYKAAPIQETSWADWEAMLSINLKATVASSRAVLPVLLAQGGGSIVHVASLAALAGSSGQAAYSAAKAAVLRFSETLADEVKAAHVRVNAVLPGTMDTPQNRSWMSAADAAKAIDPRLVGEVIAFLLSDAAAAVTGAAVKVTGQQ